MRSLVKRVVENILVHAGPGALGRRLHRGRGLILAYHNVLPPGTQASGDLPLHLPFAAFTAQLDLLERHAEVVPLPSLLTPPPADAPRPRVAITFDDAYRGAATIAVEELVRRGFPATIFVAPAFIGGREFWWDAFGGPGRGLDPSFRAQALGAWRGEDSRIRAEAAARGIAANEPPASLRTATDAELAEAARAPGVTFGSHTWSHPNLAALEDSEVPAELERPAKWLADRFSCAIPWLSYPYGLASPVTERLAVDAGYEAAVRVTGGWLPARTAPRYALPRCSVSAGMSANGFALRLAGMLAA